jgi:quercetin dioxygenase-like cupin family protein
MKFFSCTKDGGAASTVWAYWLVELKRLFSIALLCFEDGSREAYHSHSFNCLSFVLTGKLVENHLDGRVVEHRAGWRVVVTRRDTFHKVISEGRTWVLTFRGPWARTWKEYIPASQETITLTHGRKVVEVTT